MKLYLSTAAALMTAILLLIGFSSVVPSATQGADYVPAEVVDRGILPNDEERVKDKGWEIDLYDHPVTACLRENLHLYLGQKTDRYVDYGFVKLTHGVYRPGLNDAPAVVVDAYEMQTPLGAYGLFTAERNRSDKMVDIGAGGAHVGAKEAVLWKGNYFVRVSLIADVENAEDVLTMFAKKVVEKTQGGVCVTELSWFPTENRTPAGDAYAVRDLLGYACLGRGFSMEYDLAGGKATMFVAIIPPGTVTQVDGKNKVLDVQTSFLSLRDKLIADGSTPAVLPGPWDAGYRATAPKLGRGLIARSGNYIVGAFGTPDEQTAVDMVSQMVKALR